MIVNDVIHLLSSPLIIRRKNDGAILYDTQNGRADISPDIALLEIQSIRCVSLPNYPVIIFDV